MFSVCTIAEALREATFHLQQVGNENARLEADVLLADVLGKDRCQLYLSMAQPLSYLEKERYQKALYLRGERLPLAYVRGKQPFRYLELSARPGVFVPRPETEILVEQVISKIRTTGSPVKIADLGTGSGAIALSLAYELPQAWVYAADISPLALKVARGNAKRYNLELRVVFIQSDLFSHFDSDLKGQLDVVISNPPYIAEEDFPSLPQEVIFEPREALRGGEDGLDFYRRLTKEAKVYLKRGGYLAVEVGFGQAGRVSQMFRQAGFGKIEITRDLSGIERVILGRLEVRG